MSKGRAKGRSMGMSGGAGEGEVGVPAPLPGVSAVCEVGREVNELG